MNVPDTATTKISPPYEDTDSSPTPTSNCGRGRGDLSNSGPIPRDVTSWKCASSRNQLNPSNDLPQRNEDRVVAGDSGGVNLTELPTLLAAGQQVSATALACLALPDVRVAQQWKSESDPPGGVAACCDANIVNVAFRVPLPLVRR